MLTLAFQSRLDLITPSLAKTFTGKVTIYLGKAEDLDMGSYGWELGILSLFIYRVDQKKVCSKKKWPELL